MNIETYYTNMFLAEHEKSLVSTVRVHAISDFKKMKDDSVETLFVDRLLNSVLDYEGLVVEMKRVLKSNGTLYATIASIALPVDSGKQWGFTAASAEYLFTKHFGSGSTKVENYGNALSGRLLIEGENTFRLDTARLNKADPFFPVIVGVRVKKK